MAKEKDKVKYKGGLTKRWIFQTSTIIVAVLLILCIIAAYFIHSYYYSTAKRKIESYASSTVDIYFENYASTDDKVFEKGAREYIGDFTDKSFVEVWVLDKYGNVFISSSGFPVTEKVKIPEYEEALTSPQNKAVWQGENSSGENIIALTKVITTPENKQAGSVRYMISLADIDDQIATWYFIIFIAFLVLVFLLMISGTIFINSIVRPIQDVCVTAKMIADGNYDARIDHYLYNDEVGQLCDTINEMAEKIKTSDKIKNDFISTVSHELRTPLTAIKGWGETLLQIGDTDPNLTKRGMNVIINESSRLNGIVEELLDFSRIQSGRMVLKNEKMDILAELDETVFAFRDRAAREGIDLVYNAPNLPAPMDGDPDRIKQVFVNILDNAMKYTKQGGKIVVSAEVKDDTITIIFSDTGCGISAEDLPHVKEKFYKTNMTVHGSGIGLAVVDEIVRLHKGTFDIDSVLGQGTSVTIRFDIDHVELEDVWDIDAAIAAENEKKAMEENEDA